MEKSFPPVEKWAAGLMLALAAAWGGAAEGAVVYQHNFGTTTISGKPYAVAPTTKDANVSAGSQWTTSASGFIDYAGSAGSALSLANSSGTPTYTLTFAVGAGYEFTLDTFSFWRRRSTSGAQNWSMTVNGTAVGSGTVPTTGAGTGNLTPSTPMAGLTGTITVVLSLSGASGSGTFRLDDFTLNGTVSATAPTPAIALANNGTQVGAASVAAGTTSHVLHKSQLGVTVANATLTAVGFTSAGTYAAADVANFKVWYSTDNAFGSDTLLGTISSSLGPGSKSVSSLSQAINSGSTGYIFITADIAASPTAGNTINVNALTTSDFTFSSGAKSGSTTAGGAQTLQAASSPTITVAAGSLAFGNVEQNGTSGELTYTASGANLTANIVLTPPAGFEISTTSGSGFVANPATLTLTPSGGTVSSTTIYARFKPTAITAYGANIVHASAGATTQDKAATGAGIASGASDIVRDAGFAEPENVAYASYQEADLTAGSLQVGSFAIRDGGGSADLDSVGTTLSAITFNVANPANVRRIALYDGGTELGEVAGGATAAFTGLNAAAADNGSKTLTLRASFNATATDNQQVSFTVASATADAAGSGFAAADAGGAATATTGDRNRIEVTATKLVFSSGPPANVGVSADFAATVQARDSNENVDLDSTASVEISKATGAGTLSSVVGLTRSLVAGAGMWSDLQNDAGGTFTIQAAAAGLATATSGAVTACPLPAPAVQAASGIDATSFFANWSAVAGAAGYRIDVSTNADFSGGGGLATNVWEDFAGFTVLGGSTDRSGTLNSYLRTNGWTGTAVYENAGEAKLGAGGARGQLTTPTLDLSGNGGNATLLFDARRYGTDSTVVQVYHAVDGTTFVQSGSDIALTGAMATYSNALTGGTASSKVRIYAKNASNHRYYLDNVAVVQGTTGGGAFLPGFENLDVGNATTCAVGGLAGGETYYYRVRAWNGACGESAHSATQSATTVTGPILMEYNVTDALAVPNEVTDGALGGGGAEISFAYYHATGMKMAGSSYQVLAPDGSVVVAPRAFDGIAAAMVGGTNGQIYTATAPGVDPAVLGIYTARVEVVSSNDMSATGAGAFTVVDDDVAGPVHSGFNVAGAVFQTNQMVGGLVVTGLVEDASGVFAGTSNAWSLASNGTLIASGTLAMLPNSNGAGTTGLPAALSATIATNYLTPDDTIAYVFSVVSTDYDVDRPGDYLTTSNAYGFQVIPQAPEAPLSVTAVADGAEMIDLAWNKNGAPGVLVLWNTNAIADAPTQGQAYSAGSSVGAAKVVYKGAAEELELVVPPGANHSFRLYGAAGNTYSTTYAEPATTPVATPSYETGEIIDQFAYTNGIGLAAGAIATGQGWDGLWTGDLADWSIESGSLSAGTSGFPDPYANRIAWNDTSAASADTSALARKLASARSGKTFVAFMLNYGSGGAGKSAGLWLASGVGAATEELFFGKVAGQADKAGIVNADGAVETASTVALTPGADMMVVGEFDFGQKTARIWAFAGADSIPQDYTNAPPAATYSNAGLSVAALTGVRLEAESDATGALGEVRFDEVRMANTWDEVLNFNFPKAFNFSAGTQIGGTNVVTDGELSEAGKAYPVSYQLYHRTGVTNAQFTIVTNVANLTGLYATPVALALNPAHASSAYRAFTNMVDARLDTNDVTLGVYTSRVWMTAVSGKETNTLFMEGQAGASDLFFGEFGEGNNFDKYVEIYNGSGGAIDLSEYVMANQKNPVGAQTNDYTILGWGSFCRLASSPTLLGHGETMLILNGAPSGKIDPAMTNALKNAVPPRPYLITTNEVLTVSGNDPVALFRATDTNQWIDACGIGPSAARYIMRRLEGAEVPRSHPLTVDPGQWDYREWDGDRPTGYTNYLATAGVYDRNVGLGGYITFTVVDDDAEAPRMGTNNVLMVGTGPYVSLAPSNGAVEVVLTAWNFNGADEAESARPWSGSLVTNGAITCHPAYTPGPVDPTDGGTSENDLFGGYDQPNGGVAEFASIGTYFAAGDTAWIQFEIELTSAEDMVLSWAENGGSLGFNRAQLAWSSDGVGFSTNAAWPSWNPTQGNAYATRFAEFEGVVPPGLSKVYLRILLGPGYGGVAGFYRMDNVQLTGYPQEFMVTDGQIAASGGKLQFQGNLYDVGSGLDKAQAAMALQGTAGVRVPAKDVGVGTNATDTTWWELALADAGITDYVNASLTGKGLSIQVEAPDLDADRPGDVSQLVGQIGHVRVLDDDTVRPKMSLTSLKPLGSIVAQWAQLTDTNSLLPTKSDATVEVGALRTMSGSDDPKNPIFSRAPTNGYHYVEAWAWQGQSKCWLVEITPEADMAVTNLTFTSYLHRTNGVSQYRIDHYVDGVLENNVLPNTYWVDPPAMLDPTVWYARSHAWGTNAVVLEAGKVNQIRIYGLGSSNIGARWRLSELTLQQATLSTNGVTEVTDAEFTDGSFKLTGHAWDDDSGIASTNNAVVAKRPTFSMSAPDGSVYATNQLFGFLGGVADGGATSKGDGAFEGSLPPAVYTNVMLGSYEGEAQVWDHDTDRTGDDLRLRGDLALYVVDNDATAPTAATSLSVNGVAVPGTAPDRGTASWTHNAEFLIGIGSLAVDPEGVGPLSAKQRASTGIGEYRVATNDVNALSAGARAALGRPFAVAATNGALANYGFELPGTGWEMDTNCVYRSLAAGGTNEVKEGTNSLRQANGGEARQTIEFRNAAHAAPAVGVSGWYRCDSVGGATFRIEAFATNDLSTPVATRTLALGTTTGWTTFGGPVAAIGDGTVEVLRIALIDGGGNTTFWDDVRLSVDVGANEAAMKFVAGVENQGIAPQHLFAVDGDNNRAGDRLAGPAAPFYAAYDATPPTAVGMPAGGAGASSEDVDDPTTQFDLQWTPAYPDDPAHANHPTKNAADGDLLSPWKSYAIYYRAYEPLDGQPPDYVATNFIATGAYTNWARISHTNAVADPSAGGTNYLALTNRECAGIRLFDLEFDQEYVAVVVGEDRAGNEGPAGPTSWATNSTIRFALNRAWNLSREEAEAAFPGFEGRTNAKTAVGVGWIAAGKTNAQGVYTNVAREYDLIRWDAPRFQERTNNDWQLVGTVRSNWFVDDGGMARGRGQMRFYRASFKDRWKREGTNGVSRRPMVSEEVYALHNVVLSPGPNFVALHGMPHTNTFEAVFGGLETFPGSGTALPMAPGSTVVEFFLPGTNAAVVDQYWLGADGEWRRVGGDVVTASNLPSEFFARGFSITLPDPIPSAYISTNAYDYNRLDSLGCPEKVDAMVWSPILQVPTNGFSQVILTGSRSGRTLTNVYNLAALRLPVAAHPEEMNLVKSGFVKGTMATGDQIYTVNTATKSVLGGSTIYCDLNGIWRFATGNGLVPPGFFKPNDVIVIVSRNHVGSGSWTWTYHPTNFYRLPTRNMEPTIP